MGDDYRRHYGANTVYIDAVQKNKIVRVPSAVAGYLIFGPQDGIMKKWEAVRS